MGPQTQFCKNSELLGSFRKVESWPFFRPQAVHTVFHTVNANKVHYCPCLSKRIKAQILLVFSWRSSFIVKMIIPWLKMLLNLWFGCLPSLPALKWHSLQSHSNGLDFRLWQNGNEHNLNIAIFLCLYPRSLVSRISWFPFYLFYKLQQLELIQRKVTKK